MANLELSPHYIEISGPREKCGVVARVSKDGSSVLPLLKNDLILLQHRGVDSAGVAYSADGIIGVNKGLGRVEEALPDIAAISDRGVGHTRYGTDESGGIKDGLSKASPIVISHNGRSLALSHNGNIPDELRAILRSRIPSDMEKQPELDSADLTRAIVSSEGQNWEERMKNALSDIPLAYSLTMLTDDGTIFGLRSPSGTWPLWFGEGNNEIVIASENRVQKGIRWREVMPGELIKIDKNNNVTVQQLFESVGQFRCALNDVYIAKSDSDINENLSYEEFRKSLGRQLALENPQFRNMDLILGVPDGATHIAEGFAEEFGRKQDLLLKKNGDSRGFISKDVEEAKAIAEGKYIIDNPELIGGKEAVVIDDSFIKGVSAEVVVRLLEKAGIGKIHLAFALPMFVNDCDQGVFIRRWLLKALREDSGTKTNDELAKEVGVESITFMSKDGLGSVYFEAFGEKDIACMACMGEEHPLKKILKAKASVMKEKDLVFSA